MPLPGSKREKQFLSEINEQGANDFIAERSPIAPAATFLQEIKEPTHEHEELLEESPAKKKKKSRSKK